ncbi:hypothetical protein EV715DRAFT_258199, partial [Schizophyllum commune]
RHSTSSVSLPRPYTTTNGLSRLLQGRRYRTSSLACLSVVLRISTFASVHIPVYSPIPRVRSTRRSKIQPLIGTADDGLYLRESDIKRLGLRFTGRTEYTRQGACVTQIRRSRAPQLPKRL